MFTMRIAIKSKFDTKSMSGIVIAFLFIITVACFTTISAQSPTVEEVFFYKAVLCGEEVNNRFVNSYDSLFNRNSSSASARANEFARQEYYERNKVVLQKRINSVSFTKRYSEVFSGELGEYSFSDKGFPLEKITSHLKFVILGASVYYMHPDEVVNMNQFEWFVPMQGRTANAFVNSHQNTDGTIDRRVLIRITYSILDDGAICKGSDNWFSSFFHSIEVFDAKTRNLITTFKADTTPEQAKKDAPTKFMELLATLPELTAPGWDGRFKLGIKSFDPKTGAVIAEIEQRQSSLNGVLVERPEGYSRRIEGNVSGNTLELTGTWTDTLVLGGGTEDFPMRLKLWYDGAAHKLVGRIIYKENPDSGVVMSFPVP